jgi:DUF917 family protein
MGIHRLKDYVSIQTAVGGNPDTGRYLEMVVQGRLQYTANLVREASVQAGGMVAVSRDPISAAYLREHAAPGATSQAIELGDAILKARPQGAETIINSIVTVLGGRIVCQGKVMDLRLETVGGYDVGSVMIEGDGRCEVTFWNEFMTLEMNGKRRATFPDLITLLANKTGLPVSSAEVGRNQEVAVLCVPRDNLILGEGMRLPETLQEAEKAIDRPLLNL